MPTKLAMSVSPSSESNETIPFPIQAEFQILSDDDQLCTNLGYQNDWIIEATLDSSAATADSNARLEGKDFFPPIFVCL